MRFLRYFVLIAALLLWASGLSSTVSHWLYEAGVIVDDYRYGDLYRLAALPQFKQVQPVCRNESTAVVDTAAKSTAAESTATHLYIIGDSFSENQRINQSDFAVSHYQRVAWSYQQRAQLDPSKRNILLLETVERHFRQHFVQPVTELVVETDTNQTPTQRPTIGQQVKNDFHWSGVEERLESTLFSQDWAFWFKELKATLTLNWFDRWSTGVSLSRNRQHLFLKSDTDTGETPTSSFSPLTDREVNTLIDSVNAMADKYRRLGFDEVYLSIIPNKASILEPDRAAYNHLIERIQQHPGLRVPTVNLYDVYKQKPQLPYLKGDTHWNCEGRALWLNRVRQKLRV